MAKRGLWLFLGGIKIKLCAKVSGIAIDWVTGQLPKQGGNADKAPPHGGSMYNQAHEQPWHGDCKVKHGPSQSGPMKSGRAQSCRVSVWDDGEPQTCMDVES